MQSDTMRFDPATGEPRPYPSHAAQWRQWHGPNCAWLFDPWTGRRRNARDVGSDINGLLIVPAGTLGGVMAISHEGHAALNEMLESAVLDRGAGGEGGEVCRSARSKSNG